MKCKTPWVNLNNEIKRIREEINETFGINVGLGNDLDTMLENVQLENASLLTNDNLMKFERD